MFGNVYRYYTLFPEFDWGTYLEEHNKRLTMVHALQISLRQAASANDLDLLEILVEDGKFSLESYTGTIIKRGKRLQAKLALFDLLERSIFNYHNNNVMPMLYYLISKGLIPVNPRGVKN